MATSVAMAPTPIGITVSQRTAKCRLRRRSVGVVAASLDQAAYAQGVNIAEGNGGLPKVSLVSTHGSEAEVYLYGGCVTSWKVLSGKDLLFVRSDAVFNGKKPISGGIPHCFPQFGPGPIQQKYKCSNYATVGGIYDVIPILVKPIHLPYSIKPILPESVFKWLISEHGFARNMSWSIANSDNIEGDPVITLELRDDPYSRSMWDFSFQALYKIRLYPNSLHTTLTIINMDKKPFSFTTALHTYFRSSIEGVSVKGLKGCKTLNKDPDPSNPLEGKEEREVIAFPGFVDCIYLDAPKEIQFDNGLGDVISIKNTNWSDIVLWNPYLQMESCYRDFVCVENAKIGKVQLEPEYSWIAEQQISVN